MKFFIHFSCIFFIVFGLYGLSLGRNNGLALLLLLPSSIIYISYLCRKQIREAWEKRSDRRKEKKVEEEKKKEEEKQRRIISRTKGEKLANLLIEAGSSDAKKIINILHYSEIREAKRKVRRKALAIIVPVTTVIVVLFAYIIVNYSTGNEKKEKGLWSEAVSSYEKVKWFPGVNDLISETYYLWGKDLFSAEDYLNSKYFFMKVYDYKDSYQYIRQINAMYRGKIDIAGSWLTKSVNIVVTKAGLVEKTVPEEEGSFSLKEFDTEEWSNISFVSAGKDHIVAIKTDGTVVATGQNRDHQCDTEEWNDIIAVAAGGSHTIGLMSNGKVVSVGYNLYGETNVGGWNDIVDIAASDYLTVGLKKNGTVITCGTGGLDRHKTQSWKDIVEIDASDRFTVGLTKDGTVVIAGLISAGEYPSIDWDDIVSISVDGMIVTGIKRDGTIKIKAFSPSAHESSVVRSASAWSDVVAVAIGSNDHILGLKRDGSVITTETDENLLSTVSAWNLFEGEALTEEEIEERSEVIEKGRYHKEGSYVMLGMTEQDNNLDNGKEEIEWKVVKVIDGKALLVSRNAFKCPGYTSSSWADSTIRKWLNGSFYEESFSVEEKEAILSEKHNNGDSNDETVDNVFILSYAEINDLFGDASKYSCVPTEYAKAQGVKTNEGECWLWPREVYYDSNFDWYEAANFSSKVRYNFPSLSTNWGAVRPAIWIDLTNKLFN